MPDRTLPARHPGYASSSARLAAALAVCALAGLSSRALAATHTAPRPNIVLILTDDQRWDTIGTTHSLSAAPVMPQVRALLGNSGVTFNNAFAPTPICGPSRASLLSGLYAHDHGVIGNDPPLGGASYFDDSVTLATLLQSAGYRTGLYGKYINFYSKLWAPNTTPYVPPGWDEWHAFKVDNYLHYILVENGVEVSYGSTNADYSTDVLRDEAVSFIQTSLVSGNPFFLYFAPFAPHDPVIPAARDAGTFAGLTPWRPPSWNEADVSDKPNWLKAKPLLTPAAATVIDNFRIGQLETLGAVDDAVSAFVSTLSAAGALNNTIIVYVGDNGEMWGEHRLDFKEEPYEESIRVPLIIRYPPLAPAQRQENRLVTSLDLTSTFLSLAGATMPPTLAGSSLEPLLANNAPSWRSDVLLEAWKITDLTTGPWAEVREAQWKYVEYTTGETELYDLVADPFELVSVATVKANAARVATMAARLRVLRPNWPADAGCVDVDGDGYGGPGNPYWCHSLGPDCDDHAASAWSVPGEVPGMSWDADKKTLRWFPDPVPGGVASSVVYDTLRSPVAADFIGPAICVESDDGSDTLAVDPAVPAVSTAFFYLLRAENGCAGASGSLGTTSSGAPRLGRSCLAAAPAP